jgi:hypothetical protein
MLLQEGFTYTGLLLLGITDPAIYENTMLRSFLKHKNPKTQKSCWPKINNFTNFRFRLIITVSKMSMKKTKVQYMLRGTNNNNQGV